MIKAVKSFQLVVIIILLFLFSISLYFYVIYYEKQKIQQDFYNKNLSSIRHVKEQINALNQLTLSRLALFSEEYSKKLQKLIQSPDNEELITLIKQKLDRFAPGYFTFTLANSKGEVLLTDFDGFVSEQCKHDIQRFAELGQNRFTLHPNPFGYHIDYMVNIYDKKGKAFILFVSYYAQRIAKLLADVRPDEQVLLLLNEQTGLIDLTAKTKKVGDSLRLQFDKDLANNPTFTSVHIPMSQWTLVIYTPNSFIHKKLDSIRSIVGLSLLVITALLIILILISNKQIKKRIIQEQEIKNHYRKLFQESNVISFVIRLEDGLILEANQAACHFYGYDCNELQNRYFTDLASSSPIYSTERFGRLVDSDLNNFSCIHHLKNGNKVHLSAFFTEFVEDDKEFYLVQLYDVTEKEEMAKLIRQKTELLESITHALPDMLFVLDDQGNYMDVFDTERFHESDIRKTLVGKNIAEFFPEKLVKLAKDVIAKALESNQIQQVEYRSNIIGELLWYESRVIPIPANPNTGFVNQVIWLNRDIDQRKKMEMELSIAAMVMHTTDPVIICNHDYQIIKVNQSFEKVFGYSSSEVIGKTPNFLRSKKRDQQKLFEKADDALHTKGFWHGVTYNQTRQGEEIPMMEMVHSVKDKQGNLTNIVGIFKDLTEINQLQELLLQVESRFKAIIEAGTDFVQVTKSANKISYVSPSVLKVSGYSYEEYINLKPQDVIAPEYVEDYLRAYRNCLKEDNLTVAIKPYKAKIKDGSWIWIEGSLTNMRHIKGVHGMVFIGQDVSKRIEAEIQLKKEEQKFRMLIEKGSDFICVFGNDRKITYASPSMSRALGYNENELIGTKTLELVHPDDIPILIKSFDGLLKNPGSSNHLPDLRVAHKDGHYILVEGTSTALFDVEGINGVVFNGHDVTEKRQIEDKIRYQAYHDALTGLPNRRFLMMFLKQVLSSAKRHEHYGVIAFIDLDHFKNINDSLGHNIGDMLLQEVSRRLQQNLRDEDLLARLGGDEFVIVLPEVAQNESDVIDRMDRFCNKILQSMAKKLVIEEHDLYISPSIGVKIFSKNTGENLDELLQHADGAMYKAKSLGRNRFVFYDDNIQMIANQRIELEQDLRKAIIQKQFNLYYQPQYDAQHKIVGAEALIRWNHPEKGLVSPFDFIKVAEETGLILKIGKWVIEQALSDLQSWLDQGLIDQQFSLAINISPRQFVEADFVSLLIQTSKKYPDLRGMIKLEVTENLLLDNLGVVTDKMLSLKEYGVRFALDDFGTGYSSMEYLTRLPIDQLKIDRSFVKDIEKDERDAAVVEMIIGMALVLDFEVVAEGVESYEQLAFLTSHGDIIIQGYYFSKPLEEIMFVKELQEHYFSN